jgi:DNA-binding response OmpR family regulator
MLEPKRKTADLSGKRVLVVEDDPSIAIGLRINLESEGYVVNLAEDGEAGLDMARKLDPDLIVLDVMLPKRNGLEVLHDLRAEGLTMPIIILSAKAGEMDKVAGLETTSRSRSAWPSSLRACELRCVVGMRGRRRSAGRGSCSATSRSTWPRAT